MINYIGNKSPLSDFILPNCPKNPEYWIEPFGGMVGLYFTLNLKEYPDTKFIYNDINPLNCLLIEQLKKDEFIQKILSIKVDESFYLECFNNLNSKSKELKAISWLVILVCGDIKDVMSKYFRGNFNFEILKSKLPRYREYFKRLEVLNLDYKDLFHKYDSKSNVFFYLDPPYRGYEHYYTNHDWNDHNHEELRDSLFKLKSDWILSYYDFPQMKEWYKDYKMISKKHNLGTEYLILNNNI
jgi:DNA adenine methylase